MYMNYPIIDLQKYRKIIIWRIIEIKDNILHLEGEDRFWMPRETFFYFCKLNDKKFYPNYYYYSGFDFETMYGIIIQGRVISYYIKLKKYEIQDLHFYISYMNNILEIFPSLYYYIHLPPIDNSYYSKDGYIIKNNITNLIIYPFNNILLLSFESEYCKILKKKSKNFLIQMRKYIIKENYNFKSYNKSQIWLINDSKSRAGDNGEYFFRYLNKIKPEGIEYYFIIEKNNEDYERLKIYNNIIEPNSIEHLKLFLKSSKIITSVTDSWVNNPFEQDGLYISDLYDFDLIYLKNGIIKDDISLYINKIAKNFDLLITSSKFEYNYLLNLNYGYNEDNVVIAGLPRFDNLKELKNIIKKEKIIIIFPTWRSYLKGTIDLMSHKNIKSAYFINTTYFEFYNNLINDKELHFIMKKYEYKGILCLHQNFAAQKIYFNKSEFFDIKDKCNNQEILVKASLLITDYSSIFFDFGYIETPIIYTHFDYGEYRKKQYKSGYFDYKNNGFGPICFNISCTITTIKKEFENKCKLGNKYLKRINHFFTFTDQKNNYRVYNAIINDKNKNEIINNRFIFHYILIYLILVLFIKIKIMIN